MDAPPSVSVIIPTRNCLPWLPRAMASVGPRQDVEIIVFDDGSSDGTDTWLRQQELADPRLRILTGNGIGPAQARNRAINAARAPLVAFLDADDVWEPHKLDIQLGVHRAWPEIGFSFTDYRHVTMENEDRGTSFQFWNRFSGLVAGRDTPFVLGGDALARLYAENVVGTSTVIARTDLLREIGGFTTELPSSEDWDLWLRLASRAPVGCVPQVLMTYLMHRPGGETRQARARLMAMRVIGARYVDAVRAIDRSAIRVLNARLLSAEAEIDTRAGLRWRATRRRCRAFLSAPSWRLLREAVAASLNRG